MVDRIATHLGDAEMKRLQSRMARRTKLKDVALLLPWVVDTCAPEDLPHLRKQIPLLLRAPDRLFWQRRYARLTEPLRDFQRA